VIIQIRSEKIYPRIRESDQNDESQPVRLALALVQGSDRLAESPGHIGVERNPVFQYRWRLMPPTGGLR
jgi:hypothetical protein